MPMTDELENLCTIIIDILRDQQGVRREISPQSQICPHLGVCEEDLDDVMLEALPRVGRRPLMVGEPGSDEVGYDPRLTVEGLARFILTCCPPL